MNLIEGTLERAGSGARFAASNFALDLPAFASFSGRTVVAAIRAVA